MQWKRIFKGKGIYLAIVLQVFAYFYPHQATHFWEFLLDYFGSADFLYFFLKPTQLGGLITLLLPFVAVLPAALFVAEDLETGYIRLILERSGKTKYALSRMMEAISGAVIASMAGSLIYMGFIAILSPMDKNILTSWRDVLARSSYADLAAAWYGIPMVIDNVLRFAFAAAAWSLFAVAFSAFSASRGLALVLTFALHFSLAYIFESTTALLGWSPARIQVPSVYDHIPLAYVTFQQFVYFAAGLAASLFGLRYRLNKM
jgi:hypothetical protein